MCIREVSSLHLYDLLNYSICKWFLGGNWSVFEDLITHIRQCLLPKLLAKLHSTVAPFTMVQLGYWEQVEVRSPSRWHFGSPFALHSAS